MKLTSLDKSVLELIWSSYEVLFDAKQTNVAIGEMPLLSKEEIIHHFTMKEINREDVEASLSTLLGFQLIAPKMLLHSSMISDQLHGSSKIRLVTMPLFDGDRPPQECFQVTERGKSELDRFFRNMFRVACREGSVKAAQELAIKVFLITAAFILGTAGLAWVVRD